MITEQIDALLQEVANLTACSADEVEQLRIKYLSRKGILNALMAEFQTLAGELMTKSSNNGVKITSIVERYLGKGKKASEATPDQVEMLNLIILEMRDLNK